MFYHLCVRLLASITILIMPIFSCKSCFGNGSKRNSEAAACSIYHHQEDNCNAATESGIRCQFDNGSGTCRKSEDRKTSECSALTMEACKSSKFCSYLDATSACSDADPALAGKCEVIQDQFACKNDPHCAWNEVAMVCKQKK